MANVSWLRTTDSGRGRFGDAIRRDAIPTRDVHLRMPSLQSLSRWHTNAVERRSGCAASVPLVRDSTLGRVPVFQVWVPSRLDASQLSLLWKPTARVRSAFRFGLRPVHPGMRQMRIQVQQPVYLLSHRDDIETFVSGYESKGKRFLAASFNGTRKYHPICTPLISSVSKPGIAPSAYENATVYWLHHFPWSIARPHQLPELPDCSCR